VISKARRAAASSRARPWSAANRPAPNSARRLTEGVGQRTNHRRERESRQHSPDHPLPLVQRAKSIDELKNSYGVLITGAVKGEGSVNYGIQLLQQQTVYVTTRSTNIIKEYRDYLWKKDKHTEQPLNVPVDAFNHAMDAARYAINDILGSPQYKFRVRTA
jgi:hypothetical protein